MEDCLRSIAGQSLRDIEIIIQDSLSTDETEEVCRRYAERDARFRYYREKDSGQTDAINRGLERSSGKYWTWICSDDFYDHPQALEKLVEGVEQLRQKDPGAVGAFGNSKYCDESGRTLSNFNTVFKKNLVEDDLMLDWPISQPSSIILRQRVLDVGRLDNALHLGMDLDLFLRVLQHGHYFVYIDVSAAFVRIQKNSKSVMYRKKTAQNALAIIEKHFGHVGSLRASRYVQELTNIDTQFLNRFWDWYYPFLLTHTRRKMIYFRHRWYLSSLLFCSIPFAVAFAIDHFVFVTCYKIPYYFFRIWTLASSGLRWRRFRSLSRQN
jgi:glycosyltransferase involved in cell wall biosynthesis